MSTLKNPSMPFRWNIAKFDSLFVGKADFRYLSLVRDFMETFGLVDQNFADGPWLAGGTLRRLREGQVYLGADLDIFFKSSQQKDTFIELLKEHGAKLNFQSEFASTFEMILGYHNLTVQTIHRKYYFMPSDVIADFDISACQLVTNGVDVVYGKLTIDHIDKRVVRINPLGLYDKTYSAVSTVRRLMKMGADGYRMGAWHVKEYLEFLKEHPESLDTVISMSPKETDQDEVPF